MPRKKRSSEEGNYNPKSSQNGSDENLNHLGKDDFSGMEFENEEFGTREDVNPEESDIIEAREESKKKYKRSP